MHIIIDIISLNSVGIFYPLFDLNSNFNLKNYLNIQAPLITTKALYAFDFFFFRLYTSKIIELIIKNQFDKFKIIKKLTIWMKVQLYICLCSF